MKKITRHKTVTPPRRQVGPITSNLNPDIHLIRLLLARPPCERTHFLRVPLANGGSCL